MPKYAIVFMLMMMASVGLPGTGGFVGEFIVLMGSFKQALWVGALATTGMILGAPYMLLLYRRVVFGVIQRDEVRALKDLNPREILIFSPLVALVLLMGVYPKPFLDVMRPSTTELVQQHCAAMEVANVDWRSCLEPGVETSGREDKYATDYHTDGDKESH